MAFRPSSNPQGWDLAKAKTNLAKHGVAFEKASEAFFDPFLRLMDAGEHDEDRLAFVGETERGGCCSWSTWSGRETYSGSSRRDRLPRRNGGSMKTSDLKKRLLKNLPMASVTLRMPEDVVEDLKRMARPWAAFWRA